jgi:hypothetical protein
MDLRSWVAVSRFGPPSFAATAISEAIVEKNFRRPVSIALLMRLTMDHLL